MKKLLSIALFFVIAATANANYLRITNVSYDLTTQNVDFNITWNNSWRVDSMGAPYNWDAAWVFVKWRPCDAIVTDPWEHGLINVNLASNTFGNLEPVLRNGIIGIDTVSNNTGVMLRHQTNQITPSFPSQNISLNITNLPATGDLDLRVMGIEMVYVPQAPFFLTNSVFPIDTQNTVYPNGYEAFHCMKYEISNQQYAEFLNTISYAAGNARKVNTISNGGSSALPNRFFSTRPDRACNYISWGDLLAYLDWAALRPMTDYEYVKSCRGSGPFVSNEYAWGTTNIYEALQLNQVVEDGAELISLPTNANCHYNSTTTGITGGNGGSRPLRVGIFATATTTTREQTGATYYGIMEMSGNVREFVLRGDYGSSNPYGFIGTWGDGHIDLTTNLSNTPTWPITTSRNYYVGGSYSSSETECRVKRYESYLHSSYRRINQGGRGVR